MKIITREQAVEMINNTKGKFFRVDFIKKSTGKSRRMCGRTGVKKYLSPTPTKKPVMNNPDIIKMHESFVGYRSFDINSLQKLKCKGQEYKVEG